MPIPFDLRRLTVRELLQLEAAIGAELRTRELVRTNNKPIGEIAEHIVHLARGGTLEPNSTKSHDITTPGGQRIQVKAMGERAAGRTGRFSVFRSFDFDTAVFLAFDPHDFALAEAYEVEPLAIQSHIRFIGHVNGRAPTLQQVRALGRDVLPEMALAYDRLDAVTRSRTP